MRRTIEYRVYQVATALFGTLPEPAVRRIGEGLGWASSFASRKKFDLVRRNLARVVGRDHATSALTRAMFRSYGRYWAETFWVRERRAGTIFEHGDVIGGEHITEAVAAGRPIVLALPHLGNWEMAGPAARALGAPVLAVAEELPNPRIVDWFIETRAALGIDIVLAGRGHNTTARLLERLKGGGTIALLSDRDVTGHGIDVEFFGETTTLPAGPAALADRTGAALLPVGCYFKQGRGHRFEVRPPIELPVIEDVNERRRVITQELGRALEGLIRAAPHQWHLFQPNWPSDRGDPLDRSELGDQ